MCIHTTTSLLAAQVDAVDFFIPQSTHYETTTSPVRHKQAWSTWRGLSSAHAEELAICEIAFRNSIQEKATAYVDGFIGSPAIHSSSFTIKVNLVELAMEIRDVYFESSLLLSPSPLLDLSNVVQFVRLHDCFVRPSSVPPLGKARPARIQVRAIRGCGTPMITSYLPRLVFDDLIVQVEQGQNYYLKPRYTPACSVSQQTVGSIRVSYTTTCEWLKYNEEKGHFAGTVPRGKCGAQHIAVKAIAAHYFPGTSVSHEECIQASVTILPIAFGLELALPKLTPIVKPIKQVRFGSLNHARKAPEAPLLRSRNSFSALQNCSNMDQDRICMPSSASSEDITVTNIKLSPSSSLDNATKVDTSPRCSESDNSDPEFQRFCDLAAWSSSLVVTDDLNSDDESSEESESQHSEFGPENIWKKVAKCFVSEHKDDSNLAHGHNNPVEKAAELPKLAFSRSHTKLDDNLHADRGLDSPIGQKVTLPKAPATSLQAPPETDDDGISAHLCESVRNAEETEFDPEEDPRDVREMKKELLQMQLQELSTNMLGCKIDRWSSDETGLSDILESGDDSALESTLRESMGY